MEAEEYYNLHADEYAADILENPLVEYQRSLFHALLKEYVESNQKILDVGCGPGSDFDFYKSKSLHVDAIDISSEMIKHARKQAQRLGLKARIARSALENFVPDILYDIVILNFGFINTVKDFNLAIQKIKKFLNKEGQVIVVCRTPFHFYSLLDDKLHLRMRKVFLRYFKHETVLDNELPISLYSRKDFESFFEIKRCQHYCTFIPTPTQFMQSSFARLWTKMFINLDKKYMEKVPDYFGGDYVCYVLENNKHELKTNPDTENDQPES